MNYLESKSTKFVDYSQFDLNFSELYYNIVNNVYNNFQIIFQPNIENKIKSANLDFSAYKNANLEDFLLEDEQGKILIDNKYYRVNQNLFIILNIAVYEYLTKILNSKTTILRAKLKENYSGEELLNMASTLKNSILKSLKDELKKHYNFKRVQNGAFSEFYYDSKEEYIKSCINSSILNNIFLMFKSSNIYKDYEEINKNNFNSQV